MVQAHLETFELASERSSERTVVTDLEQTFEHVPSKQPLFWMAPLERLVDARERMRNSARASSVRLLRLLE